MKRRVEFLVEKRDGRREWLRATKLARSIHRALVAAHSAEAWQAAELAATVIAALRVRYAGDAPIPTHAIAGAVEQVLRATGYPAAARLYVAAGAARVRRRAELAGPRERIAVVDRGLLDSRFGIG